MKSLKKFSFNWKPPIQPIMFMSYMIFGGYAYVNTSRVVNEAFILITIIILIDWIYFWISVRYVDIKCEMDESVQKGEVFKFTLKLSNHFFLPTPFIGLTPSKVSRAKLLKEQQTIMLLGGRENAEESITYISTLCGLQQISLKEIELKSFIGFFRKEQKILQGAQIKILPEVRPIEYMQHFTDFLINVVEGEGRPSGEKCLIGAGDEISYSLRPYMEGDSQRLIHWKIAAYKDELLVRQREQESEQKSDVFFILNPFLSTAEGEEAVVQDKLLTTFVSLAGYYLSKQQKVRVAYYKNKTWQYTKLRNELELHFLQEILGEYTSLKVKETINQRGIIKSFIKMVQHRGGIKIIVSSYWSKEMEKYILQNQSINTIPYVWTGSKVPEWMMKESSLPVWHMTDQYALVLPREEQFDIEEFENRR